jgi:hypothetical protein
MLTSEGVGEFYQDTHPLGYFDDCAVCIGDTTARQHRGERGLFTHPADLVIVSTALALFIVSAGKRSRQVPEKTEVVRAREMMDWVDDKLFLLSRAKPHRP